MRRTLFTAALATLLGAGSLAATVSPAMSATRTAPHTAKVTRVSDIPVSFEVRNVNRSAVRCASDGKTYTIRGHIVGPASVVRSPHIDAGTLYLHGLSFGQFFTHFQQAKGYDFATKEARRGQVSVVIDRLGYGSSDKLNGNQVCVGSRADMAHQMVRDLRTGKYDVIPNWHGRGPRFADVALAGHSYGGQIAQVEAYSFGDIDRLIVLGYSDRIQSKLLLENAAYAAATCASGGLRVNATGPKGYAPFGPPSGAVKALFYSATPNIKKAVLQQLTIDPCGDTASFAKATKVDLAKLHRIKVPVLVVTGAKDALFPKPAGPNQARLFTGSRSVSQVTLRSTGHAFTFEGSHNRLARVIDRWLDR